jgi:hypothetical protein
VTKQELFDRVVAGLASQGFERSRSADDEACMYRGLHGRRCAAGWALPDDLYDSRMEGASVDKSPHTRAEVFVGPADADALRNLLVALQFAHDRSVFPADMRAELRTTGYEHGLVIPECLR